MVAARVREIFDERAKARRKATLKRGDKKPDVENLPQRDEQGKARDEAGEAFGVSGKQVDKATKVLSQGAKPLVEACDRRHGCRPQRLCVIGRPCGELESEST